MNTIYLQTEFRSDSLREYSTGNGNGVKSDEFLKIAKRNFQ
jgi:hypothetical protein